MDIPQTSPLLQKERKAFRFLGVVVVLLAAVTGAGKCGEPSVDLRMPPTQQVVGELSALPPERAAGVLREAVLKNYRPSSVVQTSSSLQPVFVQWVRLWQWYSLLAKKDEEEFARFLLRYFREDRAKGANALLYRRVGENFPGEMPAITKETAVALLKNPAMEKKVREDYLPSNFFWKSAWLVDYLGKDAAAEIAGNPKFLEAFFGAVSEDDFLPGVFQNLERLRRHSPQDFREYFELALALSIVFDQKPDANWPHHQVPKGGLLPDRQTVEERFDFWVDSQRKSRLLTDLRQLKADQLKFVVDALAPSNELRWAQGKIRFARGSFSKVFSSIQYDNSRVQRKQYTWPGGIPYTLENIEAKGGICVDQAYFSALAGKAKGVPTLLFVGQGSDGGHAWFGYLVAPDRWDMDAGRYKEQKFTVGHAKDPQNWEDISDHELKFLSQRVRQTPEYRSGELDLLVAENFLAAGDLQRARGAAESALLAAKQNPDAWDMKTRLLELQAAPLPEVTAHFEAAAQNFCNQADLQAYYLTSLAKKLKDSGEFRKAQEIESKVIIKNSSQRMDISLGAAAQKMNALLEAGKTAEAVREFQVQSMRLGADGGGNYFYEMVKPLVEHLLKAGDRKQAAQILEGAKARLKTERGSILANEFAELRAKINAAR